MQTAKDLKGYRQQVRTALDNQFLRDAMDKFAVAYRTSRANAFANLQPDEMIQQIADIKDEAAGRMDELYARFKTHAERKGIHVHMAQNARQANEIIGHIASSAKAHKVIKSKSMTAEETLLNHYLESCGLEVTETDLGEWIIQLRGEGPSHMVMPAIHLSRYQVADLFSDVTGKNQPSEIERLVKVARRQLRQKFVEADMGISGANFALADTGTIGLTTNEGNARLVTTLPRIHVALVGLDKLLPSLHEALVINRVLPRNATGQQITSYVTWISGPAPWHGGDAQKEFHIVFLDNGRRTLAVDKDFSEVLRCVRCGACANVCPVYRMVGGHQYGHIYIGAIGLILTYFFHGREKARHLVQNCINCGACKAVCAAGIDLPALIKKVHGAILKEEGHPLKSTLLARVLRSRRLFHSLLRSAQVAQKPVTGGTAYLRHLPQVFSKEHGFRALPAIAKHPFRDRWPKLKSPISQPRMRIALFSGCVQDFVYPEQLEAAVTLLQDQQVVVEFPMKQSCCGLPVQMMGEFEAARDVAAQNVLAINHERYDAIVTLCASCASHLTGAYPELLADQRHLAAAARKFATKILPFSRFLTERLGITEQPVAASHSATTYHAPCHLCRGLGVRKAPHDLIQWASGGHFSPAGEEETCCGFGGTYSSKFPGISAQILNRKLEDIRQTEASVLVTECPGCIMQLRGGCKQKGLAVEVMHLSEWLAQRRIPPRQ